MTRLPEHHHTQRLEDATFLADQGLGLTAVAARLRLTVDALEKWGDRHAHDLMTRLRAHEPRDWNHTTTHHLDRRPA